MGSNPIRKTTDFAAMGINVTNVKFINTSSTNTIDNSQANNLSTYFDKTTGQLIVECIDEKINQVQVYDLTGKLISIGNLTSNKVELSTIKSGLYIVKVQTSNDVYTRKIKLN